MEGWRTLANLDADAALAHEVIEIGACEACGGRGQSEM